MTTYERVDDGQVVERVTPKPGGYEDTRLGVAALEGTGGWRVADQEPAAPTQEQGEGGEDAGVRDPGGARRAPGARARTR